MQKEKQIDQYKTIPHKCDCCRKCRIYIEGPYAGACMHGGPYKGFYWPKPEDFFTKTLDMREPYDR